jgi:hypothetical protein
MKRMAAVVLAAMLTPAPPVGAEPPARSLDELGRRLRPGQRVQVLERSGRLSEGVITGLSESSLTLSAGESRTLAAEDVLRVDREGDSVRNGIVVGAVSGAAAGALVFWSYGQKSEEEKRATTCGECDSPEIIPVYAVFGAGVGWLVDHLKKGRTPLYEAPLSRTSRATVSVAPVVGRGRRGLAVAVGF